MSLVIVLWTKYTDCLITIITKDIVKQFFDGFAKSLGGVNNVNNEFVIMNNELAKIYLSFM